MFKKTLTALALSAGLILGGSNYLGLSFNYSCAKEAEKKSSLEPERRIYVPDKDDSFIDVTKAGKEMKVKLERLEQRIEDDLKDKTIMTLTALGRFGGDQTPKEFYQGKLDRYGDFLFKIKYSYFDGKNTLIKKEILEKNISFYLLYFLGVPKPDELKDYEIKKGLPKSTAKINQDSVVISGNFPFYVIRGGEKYVLNRPKNIEIKIGLGDVLDIAEDIIEKKIKDFSYSPPKHLPDKRISIVPVKDDDMDQVYVILSQCNENEHGTKHFAFNLALKKKAKE